MVTEEEMQQREEYFKEEIRRLRAHNEALEARIDANLVPEAAVPEDEEIDATILAPTPVSCEELKLIKQEVLKARQGIETLEGVVGGWFEVMKEELKDVNGKLKELNEKIENDRQYSRFNSAIIQGVKNLRLDLNDIDFIFYTAELLNSLFPPLGGKILPIHIDEAHPLKKRKGGTMLLIKFTNRWVKRGILNCQSDLEGSHIFISEHLSQYTQDLQSAAKELAGKQHVQVIKNVVHARYGGKELKIRCSKDIEVLKRSVESAPSQFVDLTNNANFVNASAPSSSAATFPNNLALGSGNSRNQQSGQSGPPASARGFAPRGRPSRIGRGGSRGRPYINFQNRQRSNNYNPNWRR